MSNYQSRGIFGRSSMMPPVIKSILIINIVVFIAEYLLLSVYHIDGVSLRAYFFKFFALWPLDDGFYIWQLISYQFMHGGLSHIFLNLFALWMFGIELEERWGSKRFLIFYLLCGVGAALTQLLIAPMFSNPAPTIGASGSVYGVLLAFGLTFPNRPIMMFPLFIPIPAKFFVLIFAGIALISGFTDSGGGIAHFAHLGGALTGFILLRFEKQLKLNKVYDNSPHFADDDDEPSNIYNFQNRTRTQQQPFTWFSQQKTQQREEPQQKPNGFTVDNEEIKQSVIDDILDKISKNGYESLTDREKRILFELSQKLR